MFLKQPAYALFVLFVINRLVCYITPWYRGMLLFVA